MHAHEHVRVPQQRRAARSPGPAAVAPSSAADARGAFVRRLVGRGGGRPLDAGARTRMGTAFGMDLGTVRVHTDPQADTLNRALSAEASTIGNDIYFREGAYRPGTPRGRRLLAHELTHVAQQGGRPGSGLSIGAPHTGAEREAEAVGERVAAGDTVDAGAVTSVAGGVVQRKYLDQGPVAGPENWIADTSVKKGLTKTSRGKLGAVDYLLRAILAGPPGTFHMHLLPALEEAARATKYDQPGLPKTSPTFLKRREAVYRLLLEIHHKEQEAAHLKQQAAQQQAKQQQQQQQQLVQQHMAHQLMQQQLAQHQPQAVHQQQVGPLHPDPQVAALMRVGFVPEYLVSLKPSGDLQLLYDADQALSAGNTARAQQIFDQLHPPVRFTGTKPTFLGWQNEAFDSMHINGAPFFDFDRTDDRLMAAQRQLITFHAQDIGGEYAKLLSYKPYKGVNALSGPEVMAARQYFHSGEIRDWDQVIDPVNTTVLDNVIDAAQDVATDYTTASHGRDQAKNRQPKPAKEALTADEVTALRIYTADEYREMNAVFRDFRVDQPTANWAKYSAIAKLAVSGLGKLPKFRGDVSYRGDSDVNFGGYAHILRKGATFRLPSFYSTTTLAAQAFAGAVGYVFHNKRAGRMVATFSAVQGEMEVLIPPGTAFRIIEVYKLVNGAWESADGTPGLHGAVATLHAGEDPQRRATRTMYLELDEVRP